MPADRQPLNWLTLLTSQHNCTSEGYKHFVNKVNQTKDGSWNEADEQQWYLHDHCDKFTVHVWTSVHDRSKPDFRQIINKHYHKVGYVSHIYRVPLLSLHPCTSSAWIFWYLCWSSAVEWSECIHFMAIFPQAARLRLAGTEEFLTFDCEFVVVTHVMTPKPEI